jgi:5-methylcytosine-specific restriction endonuclease McrA
MCADTLILGLEAPLPPIYHGPRDVQYRARKYEASGTHTLADLVAIIENQCGQCCYCGVQLANASDGHFDHVVPLARGGTDSPENIVFACRACNWSKHDRTPQEWRCSIDKLNAPTSSTNQLERSLPDESPL